MIRFVSQADRLLEEGCGIFPAMGVQIYGYAARYGGHPFCDSWVIEDERGKAVGAIGRFFSSLRVCCDVLSPEIFRETAEFVGFLSWDELEGPAGVVLPMIRKLGLPEEGRVRIADAMERKSGVPCPVGDGPTVLEGPRLGRMFEILKESVPDFDQAEEEWRWNASHLIRHGEGFFVAVGEEAVAGVTAQSPGWGYISQVAVLPQSRGRGYAGALTARCVNTLLETGRKAVLLCGEDNQTARKIYQRLGFETTGKTVRWR